MQVLKRCVRALLLHNEDLLLIRRTRPGQHPYLVTVGGGVEDDDTDLAAALRREVKEELGGTIADPVPVFLHTHRLTGGLGIQYFFAARLLHMDLAARTGSEFTKPERGGYNVVRTPFTEAALAQLGDPLLPTELAAFVRVNPAGILDAIATPNRTADAPW